MSSDRDPSAPVPSTMTAAVTAAHGGPETLTVHHDWPVPRLGPGDALVRVTAAAINNTDIWSRQGSYGTAADPDAVAGWRGRPLEFPRIQGMDIAGRVEAVASDVDPTWIRRRVVVDPTVEYRNDLPSIITGSEVDGGFAQFHRCAASQLHDVTDAPLTDAQVSCLPTAYGTALGMLNRAACSEGERVLVTGSSGGVGSAAIQLLLHRNCHVIARTSPDKADRVRRTGVAQVSVRGVDEISDLAEVDAVVDVVGGAEFGDLLDRLRNDGRLVTAGAIAGPVIPLDLRRLYLRQRTLIGSTMHTPSDFADLAAIATAGGVEPLVDRIFPLSEITDAQAHFVAKAFVGKLVLDPWP